MWNYGVFLFVKTLYILQLWAFYVWKYAIDRAAGVEGSKES